MPYTLSSRIPFRILLRPFVEYSIAYPIDNDLKNGKPGGDQNLRIHQLKCSLLNKVFFQRHRESRSIAFRIPYRIPFLQAFKTFIYNAVIPYRLPGMYHVYLIEYPVACLIRHILNTL